MKGMRKPGVPRQPGVAAEPWDTSGYKRVNKSDRLKMMLSTTINRFWRKREDNRLQSRVGPGCCKNCGSEPCGGAWGILFGDESARCCHACNHAPLDGWRPTHIIWYEKKAFFVREVAVGKAGSLYLRQDGVCWFSRIGEALYFLGVEMSPAAFSRFKVGDPHGWPEGVKGKDMGIGIEDEAFEHEGDEYEEDDEDGLGEDDPQDDEDSDGIDDDDAEDDDDADDDDDAEDDDAEDDAEDDDFEEGDDDDAEDDDAEDDADDGDGDAEDEGDGDD